MTRVSADLLRHYERIGILPPPSRSSNGYRLYAPQMVERVRAVRHAVSRGPSLAELSRIFAVSAIEAQANDAQDTASRDAIRAHLGHIATMFAAGEFSAPTLIHEQNPPGTQEMKRLRGAIPCGERGARLRITTKNAEALQAVHQFLRFQIAAHQTGDATELMKVP